MAAGWMRGLGVGEDLLGRLKQGDNHCSERPDVPTGIPLGLARPVDKPHALV